MAATKNLTWPSEKMAKFIDLTPRRLRQLVDEGVVPREERGRYNPFAVTVAYIRFLRDRVQSPELSNGEFYAAKLAKLKAERASIELDLEIKRGSRIPLSDVAQSNMETFTFFAQTLKANHNKMLTQEVINEIFEEIRNWAHGWRDKAEAAPPCHPTLWKNGTETVDAGVMPGEN